MPGILRGSRSQWPPIPSCSFGTGCKTRLARRDGLWPELSPPYVHHCWYVSALRPTEPIYHTTEERKTAYNDRVPPNTRNARKGRTLGLLPGGRLSPENGSLVFRVFPSVPWTNAVLIRSTRSSSFRGQHAQTGYPAFLKRRQCCSCAEAKRRSILILQVQADKADAVLAPLPQGEPVVWNGDYTLYTEMSCKIWCKISC